MVDREFDLTVGVLLLGLLGRPFISLESRRLQQLLTNPLNTYLYGLVTYQFLLYRITNFNDALWLKSIVGVLFVVDTVHSVVCLQWLGYVVGNVLIANSPLDLVAISLTAASHSVLNYGNPASLESIGWAIPFTAVATSVAAILTQFFLGHRVYKLTKSIPIISVIAALSSLGFVFGAYAGIRSAIINHVSDLTPMTPFVACWLGFQTAADLMITVVLTYSLARSRTGFRSTDSVINRLIRGTIQTGLFASLLALADLFSFLFHRNTNLYAMFAYPLGRIYTNVMIF
ncbi:hypothetical protein BJ912DRAFT_919996 [Pholiota molesta]|nr:hypothetical protein BJ912DRAFT_919996 [Pholiota molesta]